MIINEGFLKNAKKIASTQPQNTEVRTHIPLIKRENYEYNIKISIKKTDKNERFFKHLISSCEIFKEHSDISFNQDGNHNSVFISFDSDLFISPDTVFELVYKITEPDCEDEQITITSNSSDKKYILSSVLLRFKDIRKTNFIESFVPFSKLISINDIFTTMEFPKKTVGRWVLRRGIRIISTPIDGTIYPVYFDRPEIIHEIISSSKKYDIIIYKNDIRTVYYKEEKYEEIKEAITNSDTRKFIIYYDVHNPGTIITQPAEPMLFDREYIYPAFKTTLDENTIDRTEGYEYEYMEGIIEKADPFKISEYIDDMQYAHVTGDYKEKQRKENPQDTYLSIQATYKEKPDKDMLINKISSSDFITGKDTKTTLTYICGVFCFSAFIAGEFSYDPQKAYDFFRIFKGSDKIKVKDLRKGSFGNMNKLTIPEKDTIYEMSPNTLYFYELMKNIGIPEKKIIEWNMENKITAVSKNKSKKGVQPIYIDSIEKIINPETSISMTDAFTAEKIELQSGTSIKTLTESINRQHIHKFILTDQLSFTEITTLYPVRYKDTYIYPSFRNKYSNHFIDKLSLSTFIYYINMDENRKTSDIIFADENKTIRATGSDDTK